MVKVNEDKHAKVFDIGYVMNKFIKDLKSWVRYNFREKANYEIKKKRRYEKKYEIKEKGNPDDLISIIIPTLSKGIQKDHFFKLKDLLSKYLPSQTYSNYEAIVISDGKNEKVKKFIESMKDKRIRFFESEETRKWGHPQTRLGIRLARGNFFVRMNDDNVPFNNYLQVLRRGFEKNIGVVYARVFFKGDAYKRHNSSFNYIFRLINFIKFGYSFVLPQDIYGILRPRNIDCMNYMVDMKLARKYVDYYSDSFDADWLFLKHLLNLGVAVKFIDKVIGEKW
jgi:cellulose synthase/poly-beta-1,6-N-acetylglucosamine synthase-like glycosyltransferase